MPATSERIAKLSVPKGFRLALWATDLGKPRMMAVRSDGTIYVTRREPGDVLALQDTDNDGRADRIRTVLELPNVHGIAIHDGQVYLATVREVYTAAIQDNGDIGSPKPIIQDLPRGGRHDNRTLGFAPDGKTLYVTIGSTCNNCFEQHPYSAGIIRANPDGSHVQLFATGLRNTLGFDFHPQTGEMWGMDHGTDWLGDTRPPEELNHLASNKHYGWPLLYSDNQLIELARYPDAIDLDAYRQRATPAVLGYDAHAAPMALLFYRGNTFPAEYRGDAFVTFHGSWNRKPPAGFEIVRATFNERGEPETFVPFIGNFLQQSGGTQAYIARPCGLALLPDGSLLMSDDGNGTIWRIWYEG